MMKVPLGHEREVAHEHRLALDLAGLLLMNSAVTNSGAAYVMSLSLHSSIEYLAARTGGRGRTGTSSRRSPRSERSPRRSPRGRTARASPCGRLPWPSWMPSLPRNSRCRAASRTTRSAGRAGTGTLRRGFPQCGERTVAARRSRTRQEAGSLRAARRAASASCRTSGPRSEPCHAYAAAPACAALVRPPRLMQTTRELRDRAVSSRVTSPLTSRPARIRQFRCRPEGGLPAARQDHSSAPRGFPGPSPARSAPGHRIRGRSGCAFTGPGDVAPGLAGRGAARADGAARAWTGLKIGAERANESLGAAQGAIRAYSWEGRGRGGLEWTQARRGSRQMSQADGRERPRARACPGQPMAGATHAAGHAYCRARGAPDTGQGEP
jgi:hypothetical protein